MEYTVQKLAKLSGVTTRALRYYDEIGILKPARINSSGYRIYGEKEIDKLQQILFYRELGVGLECIKSIVNDPCFDGHKALRKHREKLLEKREQLDRLIENLDRTIKFKEGKIVMSNKEKFDGFKKKLIDENEKKYGVEIRKKYGEDTINKSNAKLMNMTEEQFNEVSEIEKKLMEVLREAFKLGDPSNYKAQEAAGLHKKWLQFYWTEYSSQAHAGLAKMYVDDERFRSYYDKDEPGTAEFLRDAILIYTDVKE